MTDRINVLVCGNLGIRDGMILTAMSLSATSARPIDLYIGTMDLTEADPDYLPVGEGERELIDRILKAGNPESRAVLLDMGDVFRRDLLDGKNMETRYTPYAMLRLCADEYELPDKLLYLDTDVIALSDVGELYDTALDGIELAGALDRYGRFFIGPRYMNSGVMLWNMTEMKDSGLLPRARKLCRDRKMLLCDQSALNRAVKKKLILPRRFNEQSDRREDTVIQHFSMRIKWIPFGTESIKPWQPELLHSRLGVYYLDGYLDRLLRIAASGYKYCE